MAWFSRKETPRAAVHARRTAHDRDTQDARTVRLRARHRLIGALALVLAVSVVLPILMTADPVEPPPVPDILHVPPAPPMQAVPTPMSTSTRAATPPAPAQESPLPAPEPVPAQPPPAVAPATTRPTAPSSAPSAQTARPPAANRAPPGNPANNAAGNRQNARTDDGVLALSLLEGQAGSENQTPTQTQGQFALQVLALSSDEEAQKQRAQLQAAGIGNAYVQAASVNGKPTWRLRVGPFPTRQAAQAVQASLRTQGYTQSFIVGP